MPPVEITANSGESSGKKFDTRQNLKTWQKGKTGNPRGRPKKPKLDAQALAETYAADALKALWNMANNPKTPPETRRKCFVDLLNRGMGTITKRISISNATEGAQGAPDPLTDDMHRYISQATEDAPTVQPQEILPPLQSDPFAVAIPIERNKTAFETRKFAPIDNNPHTDYAKAQEKQNMRDAFAMGIALGPEISGND